jgi:hypothetical protein
MWAKAIGIGAVACATNVAHAAGGFTRNDLYDGCAHVAYNAPTNNLTDAYDQGTCSGIVRATAMLLLENGWMCAPNTSTQKQSMMVVVQYMTQYPQALHLELHHIAALALARAWPCPTK